MRPGETLPERNMRIFQTEQPVALVTGSVSPRVGRTLAQQLKSEGYQVVLHGRGKTMPASQANDAMVDEAWPLILSGPIEDEATVAQWRKQVVDQFGRIDLLINTAASWRPRSLQATSESDFIDDIRVNAVGPALACKHFGEVMVGQASGGSIINVGDWAIQRPYAGFAAYFISKGALPTLTRAMAVELGSQNPRVRVNAILPGPVMLAEEIDAPRQTQIANDCLLKRLGEPNDVADAASYLATSPFVTGVCLPVDGGRSIHEGGSQDCVAHPSLSG